MKTVGHEEGNVNEWIDNKVFTASTIYCNSTLRIYPVFIGKLGHKASYDMNINVR